MKNLRKFFDLLFTTIYMLLNFDGVVESPIYCVEAAFQILGILNVLPRP